MLSEHTTVNSLVEVNRATAAEAALQADVDQNEADADAALAAEVARATGCRR